MSKLFEFFKTKNLERKFSRLGDGHRLGDPPESRSVPQQMPADPPKQVNQSSKSTNKAADAALERLNQQRGKPKDSSKNTVKHEVEQALQVQREAEELRERFTQKVVTVEKPTVIARVLFCCPALFASSVIGSRDHVDQAIHNYLIAEAESNFAEAATLILARGLENSKPPTSPDIPLAEQQTASEWREKRQQHFLRILTNLLQSPENPTFRRLRMGNNLVADLLSIGGAEMFFRACGFTKQMLPVQKPAGTSDDDQPGDPPSTEPFLVISEEAAQDAQHLQHMFDLLNTAEPILPELFRDTQVFKTSGNLSGLATRDQLPDEFFYQTKEEVKRSLEQQQRIIEESGMLMTKAMRERLRVQEVRLFRYAVVRVRMPDGLILQLLCSRSGVIQEGDRVITMNGQTTLNRTIEELTEAFLNPEPGRRKPLRLTLVTQYSVADNIIPTAGVFDVKLVRRSASLGINLQASIKKQDGQPLLISKVIPGSVASRSGSICPGDILLAVNGVHLASCSLSEAIRLLQASEEEIVTLRVQKLVPTKSIPNSDNPLICSNPDTSNLLLRPVEVPESQLTQLLPTQEPRSVEEVSSPPEIALTHKALETPTTSTTRRRTRREDRVYITGRSTSSDQDDLHVTDVRDSNKQVTRVIHQAPSASVVSEEGNRRKNMPGPQHLPQSSVVDARRRLISSPESKFNRAHFKSAGYKTNC
ncbi:unnamed protein product [Dicrocoelium dendriticum]|nr:unnamed protein product [Dicrocoelium dendriticum]